MKSLLILLFILVSSTNIFCQTTGMKYWLPNIMENQDTSAYFSSIRESALKLVKEDTLIYFTFGGNGQHGLGSGYYNPITKPYTFIYRDAFIGCDAPEHLHRAADIHNEIISLELTKRHGQGWKRVVKGRVQVYSNRRKAKYGRVADIVFDIDGKEVFNRDTIKIEDIGRLNLEILNLDKIYSHDIKIEMTLATERKAALISGKILLNSDFEKPIISFIKENISLDYYRIVIEFYVGLDNQNIDGVPHYLRTGHAFNLYIKK